MANEMDGERAQCPCRREGWITDRSNPLNVNCVWWMISHENGTQHRVTRHWVNGRFNLVLEDVR